MFGARPHHRVVQDGLQELTHELPLIVELIARTARWVHPDCFKALPVWYPETARGRLNYDASWTTVYRNKNRESGLVTEKVEANVRAGKAFLDALGVQKSANWTVCHVWGVDDPKFQRSNRIVRDPRYYPCVANMVWLPTPLKGFTDCVPEVRAMLRTCAFHLYGWACEHEDVTSQAGVVKSGFIPAGYPDAWPTSDRQVLPPGTAPFTTRTQRAIERRKAELRRRLSVSTEDQFPRDEVRNVLAFWRVFL